MTRCIKELKNSAESDFNPETIDWGFCIPDCARCCHGKGKEITQAETRKISEKLCVPADDFIGIDEVHRDDIPDTLRKRMFLKTENGRCIFLTGNSTCLIYTIKPDVCTRYGSWLSDCRDYRLIKRLHDGGVDVKERIKRIWLRERKKPDYDRVSWKVKAEMIACRLESQLDDKMRRRDSS